jgi:predicted enzyme related to lactoylglutathione lyase
MPQPKAAAVLYAKNLARLAAFYGQVARLSFVRSGLEHVVLECESFQMSVIQIPKHFADSIELQEPPVRRENTAIKLVFFVESIADVRAVASDLGGGLNPVEREWIFDGNRVCDGHDPEGNVFQLRQIGPQ